MRCSPRTLTTRSPGFRPPPPRPRLGRMAAALVLTSLAATACSRTDGAAHQPRGANSIVRRESTTTAEPTTTTPPTPEQQVKTAYLAAMSALFLTGVSPDPNDPAIESTHAGPSLARAREILNGLQERGTHLSFLANNPPAQRAGPVIFTSDTTAFVSACVVDNTRQIRDKDNEVVNDTVVSRSSMAEVRLIKGAWVLYSQQELHSWRDDKGCAR